MLVLVRLLAQTPLIDDGEADRGGVLGTGHLFFAGFLKRFRTLVLSPMIKHVIPTPQCVLGSCLYGFFYPRIVCKLLQKFSYNKQVSIRHFANLLKS